MSKDKYVGTPQTAIHINTNTLCAVIVLATVIFRNVNKDMLGVILNCLATFAVEPMRSHTTNIYLEPLSVIVIIHGFGCKSK